MLILGFIGVAFCLIGVSVFGLDLSAYINGGFVMTGKYKSTKVLDVMRRFFPEAWSETVNFINDETMSITKTITEFCVNLPAVIVFLFFGLLLIIVGFRVRLRSQT